MWALRWRVVGEGTLPDQKCNWRPIQFDLLHGSVDDSRSVGFGVDDPVWNLEK
jgi:hypothetical protein